MKTVKTRQAYHRAFALCVFVTLAACGGEGTAPRVSSSLDTPAIQVATFIDAPVSGLEYSSSSTSGLTASDYLDEAGYLVKQAGNFEFVPGEIMSFFAGNLLFGTVEMRKGMTEIRPTDLIPGADTTDPRVVRMLQALQSLDSDGDPSNGINISDGDRAYMRNKGKRIDMRDESVSDDDVKQLLPTGGFTVVGSAAVKHFEAHLDDEGNSHNGFKQSSAVGNAVSVDNSGDTSLVTPDVSTSSTYGRLLASNCFQCHGTGGTGGFENIRGGEVSEVFEFFNGQEGAPSQSIMTAHAQGFTEAQLQAIVAYLKQ